MRRAIGALVVILLACAPVTRTYRVPAASAPCQYVYGACLLYSNQSPYRLTQARAEAMFEQAARFWGSKPEVLSGWTVVMHGYELLDFGAPVWGVTLPDLKRIDFVLQYPTCPEVVFIHEFGHAEDAAKGGNGRPHDYFFPGNDDPRFLDERIVPALDAPGC